MKRIIKYACAVALTILIVAMSVLLPPYFAQRQDDAFLGAVKMDETQSESFQYKATKYQKTKVLYTMLAQQYDLQRVYGDKAINGRITEAVEYGYDAVFDEYTEQTPPNAVMTRAEAENAIVREARKLQSTGALPYFDLGKEGDYSAVAGIAFLTVTDSSASNAKFYFWEGRIENKGDGFRFIIDDEIGKVYAIDASCRLAAYEDSTKRAEMMARSFAQYHELELAAQKRETQATATPTVPMATPITPTATPTPAAVEVWGPIYSTTDKDFDIFTQFIEDYDQYKNYTNYIMFLTPTDLS